MERSPVRQSKARPRRPPTLTDRDLDPLAFLAEHRFAVRPQLVELLGIGDDAAYRRLRRLAKSGLVRSERPLGRLGPCYRITRQGLAALGSSLSAPRPVDLATYSHDLGVGWLYVAARAGVWGELREVVTERRMRSYDASEERLEQLGGPGEPLAVRLHGFGRGGRERLHYPDLVLVDRHGHRIAVELELSAKGRRRRERVLEAYAGDRRFDAVLYLTDRPDVARLVEGSARRLGISNLVHIQPFSARPLESPTDRGRAAARVAARAPARGTEAAR